MKLSSKSILSPGRTDRFRDSQISLSISLSKRLRRNGSIKSHHGQASPMLHGKRGCAFESPEPSSPKVTCIGQVRVKTKKTRSSRKEVSFRKINLQSNDPLSSNVNQQQIDQPRRECWRFAICEALRTFGSELNCFLACRSSCFSTSEGGEKGRDQNEEVASSGSCGHVLARWLVSLQEGEGDKVRELELVVDGEEEEESRRRSSHYLWREEVVRVHGEAEEVIKQDESKNGNEVEEEEKARVSLCIPPKNALLLMRCRSDPVKMAALANKFLDSPAVRGDCVDDKKDYEERDEDLGERKGWEADGVSGAEDGEEEDEAGQKWISAEEEVKMEDKCDIAETSVKQESNVETDTTSKQTVEAEKLEIKGDEAILDGLLAEPSAHAAHESSEEQDEFEDVSTEEEKEITGHESGSSSILREDELQDQVTTAAEEEQQEPEIPSEEEKNSPRKESFEEQTTIRERSELEDEEYPQSEKIETGKISLSKQGLVSHHFNNLLQQGSNLPDCLLLMMYEPKLSMEVSEETWIRSTDFIQWLPERHLLESNVQGETRQAREKDSNPARAIKPPRSSCSFPAATGGASLTTMIEERLVNSNSAAYESYALTRCKSEPVRSSGRPATEACFWRNRKLEPHWGGATRIDATGVGF